MTVAIARRAAIAVIAVIEETVVTVVTVVTARRAVSASRARNRKALTRSSSNCNNYRSRNRSADGLRP